MTNNETPPQPNVDNLREFITFENRVVWWLTRILAVVVVASGLLMPEFYDWTGADQSRTAPIVGWIALGILIADALMFFALAWFHFTRCVTPQARPKRWRFSMLHILLATMIVAVVLMLARATSIQIVCWTFQVVVVGIAIWVAVKYPWTRRWIGWISLMQFAPFLWVFRQAKILGLSAGVMIIFSGLPSLVPVAFFVHLNRESLLWITTLLTAAELAVCVWMSYLGSKRVLAGGIIVATLAVFSSFVFHALMRM